jgi:hypothetical protein
MTLIISAEKFDGSMFPFLHPIQTNFNTLINLAQQVITNPDIQNVEICDTSGNIKFSIEK